MFSERKDVKKKLSEKYFEGTRGHRLNAKRVAGG
jgi:hypothetical protein